MERKKWGARMKVRAGHCCLWSGRGTGEWHTATQPLTEWYRNKPTSPRQGVRRGHPPHASLRLHLCDGSGSACTRALALSVCRVCIPKVGVLRDSTEVLWGSMQSLCAHLLFPGTFTSVEVQGPAETWLLVEGSVSKGVSKDELLCSPGRGEELPPAQHPPNTCSWCTHLMFRDAMREPCPYLRPTCSAGEKNTPPFAGNSAPPTVLRGGERGSRREDRLPLQLVPTSRSQLGRVPPAQVISQSFTSVILRERDRTGLKSKPEHR